MRFISFLLLSICSTLIMAKPVSTISEKNKGSIITQTKTISRLKALVPFQEQSKRTKSVPSHIVRMDIELPDDSMTCKDVFAQVSDFFDSKLANTDILYWGFMGCGSYDGNSATSFNMDLFIDPFTDNAIDKMNDFINTSNGMDFFGAPLEVEPVKGIVGVLKINEGILPVNVDTPSPWGAYPMNVLDRVEENIYFENYYDFYNTIEKDISNQLINNDIELIKIFFQKWISASYKEYFYLENLELSNYVTINVNMVCLMEKKPKIHNISFNYNIDCRDYPNGKCLPKADNN